MLQVVLFLTFHAVGLSWGIIFPFHYRRFKIHGRIKYIHASTVILGFILPAFPALLQLIDGYTIGIDLHTGCVGRSEALSYYFVTLPLSILSEVTTSVFVILLWKIFKVLLSKPLLWYVYCNVEYSICIASMNTGQKCSVLKLIAGGMRN